MAIEATCADAGSPEDDRRKQEWDS